MTGSRTRPAILIAGLLLGLLAVTLQGVQGEELEKVPSEDQCRPYIEKALKDLGTEGSQEQTGDSEDDEGPTEESAVDANENDEESGGREKRDVSAEDGGNDDDDVGGGEADDKSDGNENEVDQDQADETTAEAVSAEVTEDSGSAQVVEEGDAPAESKEDDDQIKEAEGSEEKQEHEVPVASGGGESEEAEKPGSDEEVAIVTEEGSEEQKEEGAEDKSEEPDEQAAEGAESEEQKKPDEEAAKSEEEEETAAASAEEAAGESAEAEGASEQEEKAQSKEEEGDKEASEEQQEEKEADAGESAETKQESTEEEEEKKSAEEEEEEKKSAEEEEEEEKKSGEEPELVAEEAAGSVEAEPETASEEGKDGEGEKSEAETEAEVDEEKEKSAESGEAQPGESKEDEGEAENESGSGTEAEGGSEEDEESRPEEEELIMEIEIPEILRPRDHINQLLKLDEENEDKEKAVERVADIVLRDLKRLYDNAIKPLETLYKYRDLSNRHFGDPEIFSKPLVLFMGPWSGGKSSIINYLLDIEYKPTSLRTGAEPSPAYFNILMHGEEEEILDGTQLAADWTFSGLQKFGQGLLDRLKGFKLNNKLLEKVNIVEIPGILEIRKQVQRLFPFNDACQWFIDRADIIFLVYDPSKLDVGPETEAILDQLKGREYQTRIILNKADQVKPEELMRVQGALIWNISPLMSSAEPPIMYSTSLWSIPYEAGAPTRLLYAQERAFLRDLRSAIDKRVEHKIASARRFAVRVRNHAKMVDCYLTTYYNHKSFFAKKKDISDRIIENPQDYHIYEGLSTLTNISRYDLPDPDVYRDFFRLNPLYDFPLLSSTCTYFRGCPINRLDVAIAYDLPELVGKYKKSVEAITHQEQPAASSSIPPGAAAAAVEAPKTTARSGAGRMSLS